MRRFDFRLRGVLTLLSAAALLLSSAPAAVAAEKTDLDQLLKAARKYTTNQHKPGKALCVCMSDSLPLGTKRVGYLVGGPTTIGNTQYPTAGCVLLPHDLNGNYIPGSPSFCADWVPLGD